MYKIVDELKFGHKIVHSLNNLICEVKMYNMTMAVLIRSLQLFQYKYLLLWRTYV